MSQIKKDIAVFIGGRSPEHDVSVVTGLQVLSAIDPARYNAFPVYISNDGRWYVGEALRQRENYLFDRNTVKQLTEVTLDLNVKDAGLAKGALVSTKKSLLGGAKVVKTFDVAIPAFHGLYGEDGNIQGVFEVAGIPYTGMRTMASSVLMDKAVSKYALQALGIPVLPCALLKRPDQGYMLPVDQITAQMSAADIQFPCILKPTHLGSSIGVAKVESAQEVKECLPAIFEYDDSAILEPFVPNLVEYNVAVSKAFGGEVRTSAIERPKATDELLDFKQKYLSGGDNKTGSKTGGTKNPGQISEGMLSLTRELNPKITKEQDSHIRAWAHAMFEGLGGTGAPRIDFIGDSKSGEIWFNEVNPCPGSFGYFLWEAAADPILFTDFLSGLIEEAITQSKSRALPRDPVPKDARLLKRPL